MINVDVLVPALDRTYNFNLDEEAKIEALIDEIFELICKKEYSLPKEKDSKFVLGSLSKKINFMPQESLRKYSIKNGDTLILV